MALAAYLYLPPLEGNTTSNLSDLVPESAPAVTAYSQVGSGAGSSLSGPVEPPAILVYSHPTGFTRTDLGEMRAGVRYLNSPQHPYRLERAVPLAIRDKEIPAQISPGLLGQRVLPVVLSFERGTSPTGISTGVRQTREAL